MASDEDSLRQDIRDGLRQSLDHNPPPVFDLVHKPPTAPHKEFYKMSDLELDEEVHKKKLEEGSVIIAHGRRSKMAYLSGNDTVHRQAEACVLARIVYREVRDYVNTLDAANLGRDLAMVLGAIVTNTLIVWDSRKLPILYTVLKARFKHPAEGHPVWNFIMIQGTDATPGSST